MSTMCPWVWLKKHAYSLQQTVHVRECQIPTLSFRENSNKMILPHVGASMPDVNADSAYLPDVKADSAFMPDVKANRAYMPEINANKAYTPDVNADKASSP